LPWDASRQGTEEWKNYRFGPGVEHSAGKKAGMTDPDQFGKVKRWNVRRAKLLQRKGWIRIEKDLGTALRLRYSSYRTLGQGTAQREVVQPQRVRMKWEWRRRGEDDW
jgi:hypothetical protein